MSTPAPDPVATYSASADVSAALSAMKVSYERYVGYTTQATDMAALAATEYATLLSLVPDLQTKVAALNAILTPSSE